MSVCVPPVFPSQSNRLRNWWTVTQRCQYLVVLVPLGHPTTVGTRYCIVLQRVILDWLWGGPNFHTSVEDWRNWNFQCRANLLQSSWVHLFWWAGLHLEHVVLSHISTIYIYVKNYPQIYPRVIKVSPGWNDNEIYWLVLKNETIFHVILFSIPKCFKANGWNSLRFPLGHGFICSGGQDYT